MTWTEEKRAEEQRKTRDALRADTEALRATVRAQRARIYGDLANLGGVYICRHVLAGRSERLGLRVGV